MFDEVITVRETVDGQERVGKPIRRHRVLDV